MGDIHSIAVSHGEGKFVVSEPLARELFENGQVAFQYVDAEGRVTAEAPYNPNGSYYAIEGIVSRDGQILGKMGHTERYGENLFKNIAGEKVQDIFTNAVNYFRKQNNNYKIPTTMQQGEMLYEGKAKQVFDGRSGYDPDSLQGCGDGVQQDQKKATIENKGVLNNRISTTIFEYLNKQGIKTHYVKTPNDRDQLCRRVRIIPLEVIVRNVIAGSMAQRLGIEEGTKPSNVIFDICYKNDELGDPLINDHHAVALGVVTYDELKQIYAMTARINEVLKELFRQDEYQP